MFVIPNFELITASVFLKHCITRVYGKCHVSIINKHGYCIYAFSANFYFSFMIDNVNLLVPTCVRWEMNDL